MPNWSISRQARIYLKNRALELSQRSLDYAQADFPLTPAQLQYAVMPADKVATLRRYISEGTRTIERHTEMRVAFLRSCLPELKRGAVVKLNLPREHWIVVDRATQYGMSTTKFQADESHYLVPDFGLASDSGLTQPELHLNQEDRVELVAWINRVIRQKRMHEIVIYCLQKILDGEKVTPSVGHLHQIWPMLLTLINNDPAASNPSYHNDKIFFELWRTRFRAPRRAMKSYQPNPEIKARFTKLIDAADLVLTSGTILAPFTPDRTRTQAVIEYWEPAPT